MKTRNNGYKRMRASKKDKFSQVVRPKVQGWLVFSMQKATGLTKLLKNYPVHNGKYVAMVDGEYQSFGSTSGCNRAVCSTVIFTGEECNIRVKPYGSEAEYPYGIVLNPKHLHTIQGDLFASHSNNLIFAEINKDGVESAEAFFKLRSKYPHKKGYMRIQADGTYIFIPNEVAHRPIGRGRSVYFEERHRNIANLAMRMSDKHEKHKTDKRKSARVYQGGMYVPKEGYMPLNEGITYRKEHKKNPNKDTNPIEGLIITSLYIPDDREKNELIGFLKQYPHLKLYLYDMHAPKNIVRYFNNDEALQFLSSLKNKNDFTDAFEIAKPAKGYIEKFPEQRFVALTKQLLYSVEERSLESQYQEDGIGLKIKNIIKEYYDSSNDTGHLDIKKLWKSLIKYCNEVLKQGKRLPNKTQKLCEAIVQCELLLAKNANIKTLKELINTKVKMDQIKFTAETERSSEENFPQSLLSPTTLNNETVRVSIFSPKINMAKGIMQTIKDNNEFRYENSDKKRFMETVYQKFSDAKNDDEKIFHFKIFLICCLQHRTTSRFFFNPTTTTGQEILILLNDKKNTSLRTLLFGKEELTYASLAQSLQKKLLEDKQLANETHNLIGKKLSIQYFCNNLPMKTPSMLAQTQFITPSMLPHHSPVANGVFFDSQELTPYHSHVKVR